MLRGPVRGSVGTGDLTLLHGDCRHAVQSLQHRQASRVHPSGLLRHSQLRPRVMPGGHQGPPEADPRGPPHAGADRGQ